SRVLCWARRVYERVIKMGRWRELRHVTVVEVTEIQTLSVVCACPTLKFVGSSDEPMIRVYAYRKMALLSLGAFTVWATMRPFNLEVSRFIYNHGIDVCREGIFLPNFGRASMMHSWDSGWARTVV